MSTKNIIDLPTHNTGIVTSTSKQEGYLDDKTSRNNICTV
jgi:hypothetical protein